MSKVLSLGSINVDRIQYLPKEKIRTYERRHNWFPAEGQTLRVEDVPATVVEKEYENFIGGKGANQAVAAANVADEAALLGSVGDDAGKYDVLSTLANRGVSVDSVKTGPRETGKAYIFVDESGQSWIAIVEGANTDTDSEYAEEHYDAICQSDVLLLQNEIPVETMASVLDRLSDEQARPTIIFNPSPTEGANPIVEHDAVDIVVVNQSEYTVLNRELQELDGTVVRTRGADDTIVDGETEYQVTPPSVDPVDTTGAGDVFCGYLAAHLADGHPLERAVDAATVAASYSTEVEGAQEAISKLDGRLKRVEQTKI